MPDLERWKLVNKVDPSKRERERERERARERECVLRERKKRRKDQPIYGAVSFNANRFDE